MGISRFGLSLHHTSPRRAANLHSKPPSNKFDRDNTPDERRNAQIDHQDARRPRFDIALGGTWAKLYAGRRVAHPQKPGKRGQIIDFTRPARSRLLRLFGIIDRRLLREIPLFVTLTYPATWPDSARVWKQHLDAFAKRFARCFPGTAFVWRLEFQQRGAPHFHLLVFGVRFIPSDMLARWWYEIVGSGDTKHLAAGVEVTRLRSWRGVLWYVSKYMGKVGAGVPGDPPGRFWGVRGRRYLPKTVLQVVVTFAQFFKLRRLLWRRMRGAKSVPWVAGKGRGERYKPRLHGEWKGVTTWGAWDQTTAILGATLFGAILAPGGLQRVERQVACLSQLAR